MGDLIQRKRLPIRSERIAKYLSVPSNWCREILGWQLYPEQAKAIDSLIPAGSRSSIAACNGAGKTARLIPALALWHQWHFPLGRVTITTGSWAQIETQVWPAIEQFREKFPMWRWYDTPKVKTLFPGDPREGFIWCRTTNHAGFAEGLHEDGDEVPTMFIGDEAKTLPGFLKKVVMGRVRPTRTVLLSSHGITDGWFYETQTTERAGWNVHRITADDCAHISKEEIAQVRADWAGDPQFADAVLGYGFIPLIGDAVIPAKALEELLSTPPKENTDGEVHAACDFAWSSSRGENVLALRRGNVITIEKTFHCDHLVASEKNPSPGIADIFEQEFNRLGLQGHQISGDEGSGGRLVMDELDNRGWYLNRINNQAPAANPDRYDNDCAQDWYEFSKMVTAKARVLPHDPVLRLQLINRRRKHSTRGKLAVESKEEMLKRNVASPDRADAVVKCSAPKGGHGSGICTMAIQVVETRRTITVPAWHRVALGDMLKDCLEYDEDAEPEPTPEPENPEFKAKEVKRASDVLAEREKKASLTPAAR